MELQSILGSVALGKDTTGNFKQSLYGLAVRSTPDGKFITHHKNKYIDVTISTFDGTENLVYRLPVKRPTPGDIIIRSDDPFSVLFVEKTDNQGNVTGFDPATEDILEYHPVSNMFNLNFFVKVVGPNNLMAGKDSGGLLPLMLLSNQGAPGNSTDALSTFLIMKSLGSEELAGDSMLPFLLLSTQKSGGLDPLALMLALSKSKNFDLFEEEKHEEKTPTERKDNPNRK